MIQFDEHIFQMGWFNHQLVYHPKILWFFFQVLAGKLALQYRHWLDRIVETREGGHKNHLGQDFHGFFCIRII